MKINKEELQREIDEMNKEIESMIKIRSEYLDNNMKYFAEFQIGDEVVHCATGERTIVTEQYRYHAGRDVIYDTSLRCDCRFKNGDNTSRYAGSHPYVSLDDYRNRTNNFVWKLQKFSRR